MILTSSCGYSTHPGLMMVDPPPLSSNPQAAWHHLETLLLANDSAPLRELSESGELGRIIPEWNRLTGTWNTQHRAHHYPLDDHTLRVVEGTKESPYYTHASANERWLAAVSALLHDIDKNTGPLHLRAHVPVDKLHPIKSAVMTYGILGRFGIPDVDRQKVFTLIHHHQAFGRLFIIYPDGAHESVLEKIALKIRSPQVLQSLLALSEGDIRGVRGKDAIFTPEVAEKLAFYAKLVETMIQQSCSQKPLPEQRLDVYAPDLLHATTSCGFVLPAENWDTLFVTLSQVQWGGALPVRYASTLTDAVNDTFPVAAVLEFLPENLAYVGTNTDDLGSASAVSMAMFYHLWRGQPMSWPILTPDEQARLNLLLDREWTSGVAPAWGIGTRPILKALISIDNQPPSTPLTGYSSRFYPLHP